MKLPRQVLVVIAGLAAGAAALGLLAGSNAQVTEAEVINAGAAIYVAETGRERTECIGLPGAGHVWIEVRCGDADAMNTYLFDVRGRRLRAQMEPKT